MGAVEAAYAANELGMREMQAKVFEARSKKSPNVMDIMIAMPDAEQAEVKVAVNDFLKAITASLLMEQVMAPSWKLLTLPTIATRDGWNII